MYVVYIYIYTYTYIHRYTQSYLLDTLKAKHPVDREQSTCEHPSSINDVSIFT